MRTEKHVICWDFDDTLGNFYQIEYEAQGRPLPQLEEPLSVRYGIENLLQEFSPKNGFVHVIATTSGEAYVQKGLRRTGLSRFFKSIFDGKVVSQGYGKLYTLIQKSENIKDPQAHMIAIGDKAGDASADINGMVFINVAGKNLEALVIREILVSLLEAGEGNFKKGFDNLYGNATPDDRPDSPIRSYTLPNGISFDMTMREMLAFDNIDMREKKVLRPKDAVFAPTIELIRAPQMYKSPFRRI